MKNLTFNRIRRDKIEDIHIRFLSDTVNTPHALFQAIWIPGNVIINHQMTELEIDTFTSSLSSDTDLLLHDVKPHSSHHEFRTYDNSILSNDGVDNPGYPDAQ